MKPVFLLAKLKLVFKWVVLTFTVLVLLLLIFIELADRYLASGGGARWLYKTVPDDDIRLKHTPDGVRYLCIGDTSKMPLLLIHGAPGGFYDWLKLAKERSLYQRYYFLIPERAGYGGTRPRGAVTSIRQQAELLLPLLDHDFPQPAVIVGHSYGAPIAMAMGALAPERVAHIYGLSGAYDPEREVTFRISYWIDHAVFRYLLPRYLWVANEEKLHHPEALRQAKPLFQQVQVPVTLVHGSADSLVPFGNSQYLQELLPQSTRLIQLKGYDHPIHFQVTGFIASLLLGEVGAAPAK